MLSFHSIGPRKLKLAICSLLSEAPTHIDLLAIPGQLIVLLLGPLLPAAMTNNKPLFVEF